MKCTQAEGEAQQVHNSSVYIIWVSFRSLDSVQKLCCVVNMKKNMNKRKIKCKPLLLYSFFPYTCAQIPSQKNSFKSWNWKMKHQHFNFPCKNARLLSELKVKYCLFTPFSSLPWCFTCEERCTVHTQHTQQLSARARLSIWVLCLVSCTCVYWPIFSVFVYFIQTFCFLSLCS